MSMPLKVPFVRKHIHSWKLVQKRTISGGVEAERECTDPGCGRHQIAKIAHADVVPDPYLSCADAFWEDGKLEPFAWTRQYF